MSRSRSMVVVSVALMLLLAACGGEGDGGGDAAQPAEGGTTAADGGAETGVVEFGAICELTGEVATFGEPACAGIEIAVQEINDAGGFEVDGTTYTIDLEISDDQNDLTTSTGITTGYVEDQGYKFIFGPVFTGQAVPDAQITQSAGALHFSPATGLETILLNEPKEAWSGLFRTQNPNDIRAQLLGNATADILEPQTVATLLPDAEETEINEASYSEALEAQGIEVVAKERYPEGTSDFSPFLSRIKQSGADVLALGVEIETATAILRQALELDVADAYFGLYVPTQPALEGATGSPIDAPFLATYTNPNLDNPATPELEAIAEKMTEYFDGELPTNAFGALWYYDPVHFLVQAMQEAGTVEDTAAIAEVLETSSYEGALGTIEFNEQHTMTHAVEVCLVEEGEVDCQLISADTATQE